ncbi:MAG: tyrosine-type recombinase/integrase [Frankiaceae bacterium]
MSGGTGYDADLLDYIFWATQVRGLADNTVRVRMDFLRRLQVFAGVALRDIEPGHLTRFERVAIAGRAPESRRSYICHLRAFYAWAVKTGIVEHDPTEVLTLPRVPKHLPRPIEEDDLAVALKAARPKMAAIITLAAYAGLRCCEIAGLSWEDLRREPDGGAYLHITGKGDKDRRVEVGQTVLDALQRYGLKRRGPMFLGLDGRPIAAKSVSSSGNRFLQELGLEVTMHQLRHRYGTVLFQVSRDLRMVQEQLGHASPQTTAVYTRPSQEAAARAVRALDALKTPAPRPGLAPAGAGG